MPTTANHGRVIRRRSRRELSHLQSHATRRPARLAASGQLMAQGGSLLLPRLAAAPLVHRFVADDRLAVMLAKSLVELDIAMPGDWERADCDPTSFIRLTLERWIKAHGESAIRRRFLLVATISDTPCEWTERDQSRPNQLFLIIEPSEASCGCVTFGPTLQLLENVHPQLPATFFHLFVGALNRWLRVYDFCCRQQKSYFVAIPVMWRSDTGRKCWCGRRRPERHISSRGLETPQERHEPFVARPPSYRCCHSGFAVRDGFGFGFQIHCGIDVSRVDGNVAEPVAYGVDVQTATEEMGRT